MSRIAIATPDEQVMTDLALGTVESDPVFMEFVRRQLYDRVRDAIEDGFFEGEEANDLVEMSLAAIAPLPKFWVRYKMLSDMPSHAFGQS